MAFYQFIKTQKIPATMSAVWDFMSSPMNLKDITPSYMNFTVTNQSGQGKMYPGMIITYTVSPLMGIPLNWMTEITHVKEMEYFVDEQRSGPYKLWHHQHKIEPIEGGVIMTDIVTYAPPLGMLGQLANILFIRRQLESIFEFRRLAVEKKFGIY
ncbi:MAG: SRPBCC family protein [Ferruginibacter sp.]|nr:SRPBCC family protein [Ferruginibacter sp.]